MDADRPPERWSLLDAVGWFCELPGRALRAMHRFCHRWEPECPACAANLRKADDWANNCRIAEELLAADCAKGDRGPVTDADIAVAYGTLLTGQTPRLPQPNNINQLVARIVGPPTPAAPLTALPPRKLAYHEVVAMQQPKGPPIIPEGMQEAMRALACPPADSTDPPGKWGRVNIPLEPIVQPGVTGQKHPAHSRPASAWAQLRTPAKADTPARAGGAAE